MNDINTVSLSGVLNSNVETAESKGIKIARFFLCVEGAGDQKPNGVFKVVAFAEWAELAKTLLAGDRIVLVGALLERKGRGRPDVEIRVRNLIPLPTSVMQDPPADFKVSQIE